MNQPPEASDDAPDDDESVSNETLLYRWVPPDHVRWTENGPEVRDGAFKNFPNAELKRMSVVLDDRLVELERIPASILEKRPHCGLVGFLAGTCRHEKQRIARTPQPDEAAHGDVWGEKPGRRRKAFAAASHWVIEPPPPAAS